MRRKAIFMQPLKNKMIIELYGLPGAGKTTLAKKMKKEGFFVVEYPSGQGKKTIRYIFKHPIMTLFWLREILLETIKTRTWSLLKFKIALVMNTFGKLEIAKKSAKNKIIVDEGLFQRILSIYETKKSFKKLSNIIKKNIPQPDLIVIVKSDFEKFMRYKDVKNIRTHLGPKYLNRWFEAVNHNYKNIVKVIKKLNIPYRYIKIDSSSCTENWIRK